MGIIKKKNKLGAKKSKSNKIKQAKLQSQSKIQRKQQLPQKDFRRQCIQKGIYPKDSINSRLYYTKKDLKHLQNEPIHKTLRENKIYKKKLAKYKHLGLFKEIEKLELKKPELCIDHLIRERYPTFNDALRNLSDPLSTLFLYRSIPRVKYYTSERSENVQQICYEFMTYCALKRSIVKSFISIKGFYFQAIIDGIYITWLIPHNIMQHIPKKVDFATLSTFLLFYETLCKFVNYKLYTTYGLPFRDTTSPLNREIYEKSYIESFFSSKKTNNAKLYFFPTQNISLNTDEKIEKKIQNNEIKLLCGNEPYNNNNETIPSDDIIDKDTIKPEQIVFKDCVILISREVPFEPVALLIRSGGGIAIGEIHLIETDYTINDTRFTHQIVDRPTPPTVTILTRKYVQPQWIFDSFNERFQLPLEYYSPGKKLPPHLSPFVDDYEIGYIPDQRKQLDLWAKKMAPYLKLLNDDTTTSNDIISSKTSTIDADIQDADIQDSDSNNDTIDNSEDSDNEVLKLTEKERLAATLLSGKKIRILNRLKYSKRKQNEAIKKLQAKRDMVKSGKFKPYIPPNKS